MKTYECIISFKGEHFCTIDLKSNSNLEARNKAVEIRNRFTTLYKVVLVEWTAPIGIEVKF